jgi:hypothetical protein
MRLIGFFMKDDEIKNSWKKILWQIIQWREWKNCDRVGWLIWWHQQAICSENLRVWGDFFFKNDENIKHIRIWWHPNWGMKIFWRCNNSVTH